MLALMGVAAEAGPATLVFDEVDAGIGGQTARAVGEQLRDLAAGRQVICITHLPQIASLADRHFTISELSSAPSRPWSCALTQRRATDGGRVGDRGALEAGLVEELLDEARVVGSDDRHERMLRGLERVDDDVVDADAHERRQQVLNGLDRDLVDRQAGRELNPGQVVHRSRHLVIAQIGTPETDTEIRGSGLECKVDLVAGVKTNSDARNLTTKCTLCVH